MTPQEEVKADMEALGGKELEELCVCLYCLRRSVKLQSHYAATLLNMLDGGQRMTFDSAAAWIFRLGDIGAQLAKEREQK